MSDEPFLTALEEGNEEVVRWLLTNSTDMDLNRVFETKRCTPLYTATARGHAKCVAALLEQPGLDPNIGCKGFAPLHVAVYGNHDICLEALLADSRTDPNKEYDSGCTPLFIAASKGYATCLKALLKNPRIDCNKSSHWGVTPLHAAVRGRHAQCVETLLAHPDIQPDNVQLFDDMTALHTAASTIHIFGNEENARIISMLLAHAAVDPNKRSRCGYTPLRKAIKSANMVFHMHARPDHLVALINLFLTHRRVDLGGAYEDALFEDTGLFYTNVIPEAVSAEKRRREQWQRRVPWIRSCLCVP